MVAPICWPAVGPEFDGVLLGATTRGHLSDQGFNLGAHVGDHLPDVQNRRTMLEAEIKAPVVWLNQVHGVKVMEVAGSECLNQANPPTADASVTSCTDVALAVMTADCLPVVLVARNSQNQAVGVGVAHAGWRGLCAGVLEHCVSTLAGTVNLPTDQVHAWMGPAIGPQSYEVGGEVRDAFTELDPDAASAFSPSFRQGHWMADLYRLATLRLRKAGVKSVAGGGFDTFTESRWFSHRRSQSQGLPAGRIATFVRLLPGPDA